MLGVSGSNSPGILPDAPADERKRAPVIAHRGMTVAYAFTEGRCPIRANQAAMLVLAASSGCPTWPPKSIQQ